jgi:2-phospho-L-lactate guanylyltransferase (CobY/MobA/RfbA family)
VVTADPEVAGWAESAGVATHPDPGQGLSQAALAGVEWALDSHGSWLVIHSDLPLLTSVDVAALAGVLELGRPVIAPSADGGTSAIGWDRGLGFSFGVASFHRHLVSLDDPVIVSRRGLLLDVDSPRDLKAVAGTRDGGWLRDFADQATTGQHARP